MRFECPRSTKYPAPNPHKNKFWAEVSRYLSYSQYTGTSPKPWYLRHDPADVPVIDVAFLNRHDSPTIETGAGEFNRLGVQVSGYHDFGVNLQEGRLQRVEAIPFTCQRGQVVEVV
jgi:hypothetical protein